MRIRVQELQRAAVEAMLINLRDGDGGALAQMVELKISLILQVGSSLVSILFNLFLLFFPYAQLAASRGCHYCHTQPL